MIRHSTFDRDCKSLAKTKCRSIEDDIAAFLRLLENGLITMDEYNDFKPNVVYKARAISKDIKAGKSGALRIILERRQRDEDSEEEWVLLHIYLHNQQGTGEHDLRAEIRRRLKMDY